MTSIRIPLLLILLLCIAVPAFGADTVRAYDTVVHYDTTYLYDTTLAVQRQLSEMKSEFYDKAIQSLDDKRSNVNIILIIIAILTAIMTIVFGFMTWLMHRSRGEMDRETKEIRDRKDAIDKLSDEIMLRERRFKQSMAEIEGRAERIVAAAEKKAQEKSITSPDEKIKLINEADAEQSIEEYEKLLFAMEVEGVSKDRLPTSLHKNVGLNYYRLNRYEKAVEEFLLYLDAFPNDELSLFSVAYCYNKLKNYENCIGFYRRLTQIDPTNYLAYTNWGVALGKLYDERKDVSLLEEAIDKNKKALEINDKSHLAWSNQSAALFKKWHYIVEETGKSDETLLNDARGYALKALEIAPERKDRNFNLACAESLLENKTEMLKALKIAIEYDPELKKAARDDVDFAKYRDDPDFIALTKED